MSAARQHFQQQFQQRFALQEKGMSEQQLTFAQRSLSALLGGMGFFYGSSQVSDPQGGEPTAAAAVPLFTGTPSRSFFPRGFLWDEGFHQLLVSRWDESISVDVLSHWLGTIQSDGWIPREQILGAEARRRVPDQFVVQHRLHANPPTFLLLLHQLLSSKQLLQGPLLAATQQRIALWFKWLERTQRGKVKGTFRWRGRDANDGKLNAMTLSSGLDDYPRASSVSDWERHVDLLCWVALGAQVMEGLAEATGGNSSSYQSLRQTLQTSLLKNHWDNSSSQFSDYGQHCARGKIKQFVVVRCSTADGSSGIDHAIDPDAPPKCPGSHPKYMFPLGDGQGGLLQAERYVEKKAKRQFVKHTGYVTMFPLMLRMLAPDAPQLGQLLTLLTDPEHLWTPYGIRSLSTTDFMYLRANAAGDAAYWRGPIWINCNYLVLYGLWYYKQQAGPYQQQATEAYQQLRANLMQNMMQQWQETGFLWEQYNDQTGLGQRTHPFNGWSSLIVLIMAELY